MNIMNFSRFNFLRGTTAIAFLTLSSFSALAMDPPPTELSSRIPVKSEGSKNIGEEKVVIIGGGLSGLTTAFTLQNAGVSTTLYEGRGRLGGRAHTVHINEKQYYEEGGTFIDENHTAILALVKKLNVKLKKRGYGSPDITVVAEQETQKTETLISELKTLKKSLEALNSQIDWTHNWTASTHFDEKNNEWRMNPLFPLLNNLSPFAQNFIQTYVEDEIGIAKENVSVYAIPNLVEMAKEYLQLFTLKKNPLLPNAAINQFGYDYTVVGGTSCLVKKLENQLNPETIHLNHRLTEIDKEDQYLLTFQLPDGRKEIIKADRVIMTLPFSTLRDVNIKDSVGLSALQKKAIQTLPYGTNSKIGIPLNKNIDNMLYYLNFDDKLCGWPGEHTLTLMVNGEAGRTLSEEQALPIFEAQRNYIFQNYAAIPNGAPVIKNWSQDPFSKGSYSACSVDMESTLLNASKIPGLTDMREFAEPIGNSFFFAGEHTRMQSGFMNSAVASGEKAAKLVTNSLEKKPGKKTTKKQTKPTKVVL